MAEPKAYSSLQKHGNNLGTITAEPHRKPCYMTKVKARPYSHVSRRGLPGQLLAGNGKNRQGGLRRI